MTKLTTIILYCFAAIGMFIVAALFGFLLLLTLITFWFWPIMLIGMLNFDSIVAIIANLIWLPIGMLFCIRTFRNNEDMTRKAHD